MEINKVQWRMIAKGEKLPCDSFLMKKDGTMTSMVTGAGVTVGQDAYYLPVEELRTLPKEESEDERMIQYFKDLAPFDKAEELYEKYGFSHKDAIDWLEKQAEQKPTDKVVKVGDWVVVNDGRIGRIIECTKDFADVDLEFSCLSTSLNNIRSWTIQDAKAGDVLINWDNTIFIFKSIEDDTVKYHIAYNEKWHTIKTPSTKFSHLGLPEPQFEFHPATKEQCDLLFKEMKEAGFEWDAEKKELKKVEQKPTEEYNITGIGSKHAQGKLGEMIKNLKPISKVLEQKPTAWSEEDSVMLWLCVDAASGYYNPYNKEKMKGWLYSLKDRVQPQPKQWSEEDEINLERAIWYVENPKQMVIKNSMLVEWLKSLKDRVQPWSHWKPSDEQLYNLSEAAHYRNGFWDCDILIGLYDEIKKLREK